MKTILLILAAFIANIAQAANIRMIEDDAFSSQETADEAAKIINQNFSELFAVKLGVNDNSLTEPQYFVGDLFDPDQADYNAFVIMENADDLWREKSEASGLQGSRLYQVTDLLDPHRFEENIAVINQIFFDLDSAKEE